MLLRSVYARCVFVILLVGSHVPLAFGCSAFLLHGKDYCVIGFNENWKSMPGMVVVNNRGETKANLSWKGLTNRKPTAEHRLSWKAKYGSVTFNLLGIDMPCYGVNEKGLFVVELYLEDTYSRPDSTKANMFWGQWIQYQLDNFATVKELVAHLNEAPVIDWWPAFPGSHFFVADKKGHTAAIEQIDGRFEVSYKKNMPVPVLCNSPYQDELSTLSAYQGFGGEQVPDIQKLGWENRFVKASHLIERYEPSVAAPVDYAWNVLDSIFPGQWQMVADVLNGRVYFRTDQGKAIKYIDLADCDFSSESPVTFIDINSDLSGNVHARLETLTPEVNQHYVEVGFPIGYANKEFFVTEAYDYLKDNVYAYVRQLLGGDS